MFSKGGNIYARTSDDLLILEKDQNWKSLGFGQEFIGYVSLAAGKNGLFVKNSDHLFFYSFDQKKWRKVTIQASNDSPAQPIVEYRSFIFNDENDQVFLANRFGIFHLVR